MDTPSLRPAVTALVDASMVTVERGRILSHQLITLKSNSHVLDLPITPDMAPNALLCV
jgi:hypothetical protein